PASAGRGQDGGRAPRGGAGPPRAQRRRQLGLDRRRAGRLEAGGPQEARRQKLAGRPVVSGERHGDAELAERLAGLPGPRHRPAAAAVVTAEETRSASLGAGLGADFEIGSIAKGITGLLYAEALARGEAGPGTPLGDLLPLADVPVGKVTLGSLSTHRSGLPSLPAAAQPFRRTVALWRRGANPYGE